MRKLDSHALQVFVAVATCLNFRQAAEQLHMTQPPLSRAIRQLETRLATQLFERDTQHVALTPAGRQLLPMAQQILAMLDAAELAMRDHPAPARVRLGLTSSVEADLFRPFTQAMAATLGGSPEPVFATSPQLVASVRAGRLDAAVIALPTATGELAVQTLGRQPLLAALASRHPLARRRTLTLADLASESVYWFERARQPAFFDHCHAVFKRHQFAPAFVREPHDHHVLLSDVAAGKGIALLPASFAALRRRGVAYRKLAEGEELAASLGLVTAPGHPAAAALADLARRTLA
ncbi:LysR family transcriptional regulator [Rugamonas apoptosis]|uniref:LysR family transcriptional regulator n=1 Tax=Rugamonas apoptosis TaxID=2758570 RepID=A0A7W2IJ76_9BURK|nr:LysR family transcriptional regulator [Rugamonas apoptosis]MBA5686268.1 LysR family transcriptional regulator [Rugamonas apoptosis]